jgi:hypothetical protein
MFVAEPIKGVRNEAMHATRRAVMRKFIEEIKARNYLNLRFLIFVFFYNTYEKDPLVKNLILFGQKIP